MDLNLQRDIQEDLIHLGRVRKAHGFAWSYINPLINVFFTSFIPWVWVDGEPQRFERLNPVDLVVSQLLTFTPKTHQSRL